MNTSDAILQIIADLRTVIADNETEIGKLRQLMNEQNNSMSLLKTALDNALMERDNLKQREIDSLNRLVSVGKKVSRVK